MLYSWTNFHQMIATKVAAMETAGAASKAHDEVGNVIPVMGLEL
jgi:hypothetical protein